MGQDPLSHDRRELSFNLFKNQLLHLFQNLELQVAFNLDLQSHLVS